MEERGLAKGNPTQLPRHRAQDRTGPRQALERIRQAARKDRELRFTSLWHHVYDKRRLQTAFYALKRRAAAGIDGETWDEYERDLEERLEDLSARLKRGAYRTKPLKRVWIPKPDGRKRPIGIPVLEDKLVQRALAEVMNAIYEVDFLGFSYGFRPGRTAHQALDALTVGIYRKRVNWILDADIRSFFDTLDHECLLRLIENRIADPRVLRMIRKWLKAGVMEEGKRARTKEGTPQGGSISPLLANIYLHYVLDDWALRWRADLGRDVILIRYADDFVVGFQHKTDAKRFLKEVRERFRSFHLELHPEKTRLIEFGRFAAANREGKGQGKPETFDFLGFTHISGQRRDGEYKVIRQTIRKRMATKLKTLKQDLTRRRHLPIPEVGRWLRSVVIGHFNYYGVPGNYRALNAFRNALIRHWRRALSTRSQRGSATWTRTMRLADRWLPTPHIQHPYPKERFDRRHPRQEPSAVVPHAGI